MNKVRSFTHLSKDQRIKIEVLLHQGWTLTAIGKFLNRPTSTISREVKRNGPIKYRAERADYFTDLRHRQKRKHSVFNQQMKEFIVLQLRSKRLSPELIYVAGKKVWDNFISIEWIYQWIWHMKFSMAASDEKYRKLYNFLRHGPRRRRRGKQHSMRGNIIDRKWIEQRPAIVAKRMRLGDLEADIILGKDRQPGLLVALDRRSRKTWIRKLKVKDADYVMGKFIDICKEIGKVRTVTFDNDQSFAEHYRLNKMGVETFFTHPYSAQEKGSVENRIGIIRMFFPKKTNFREVNEQQVINVQKLINNRPLRMFNYKSPNEKFIS
jgi:IS30 family transposase